MPNGSDMEKIGASQNLRRSNSRRTRTSLPLISTNSPAKRRRSDNKKKATEKEEEENRELVERIARVQTTDNESAPPPSESIAKRRPRKMWHPSAEIYTKKLYRRVATGYDLDADSDSDMPGTSQQAIISDNWKPEYSGGTQELAHPDSIPKMEIREDDFFLEEKTDFCLPSKLVATNSDTQYYDSKVYSPGVPPDPIHYEVTAQDLVFIEKLNQDRQLVSGEPYLTSPKFSKIIESLEIEAFKKIHDHLLDSLHVVYTRPSSEEDDGEDAECDVCRIPECDIHDEMVFCDMCNTCVHMVCAGISELPEKNEPWKCQKCEFAGSPAPKCALCPALGGSMTSNRERTGWAHHSCALFIPEIIFENEELRAPMTAIETIPAERWAQLCAVCDTRQGACVTCSWPDCEETHHVCCALRVGLTVRIQEIPNDPEQNVTRVTYCHRHSQGVLIDDKFRESRNPWLARLESVFYLMTDYEKVAEKMNIEEIIVSDVYEYWKQKRLSQKCHPLIRHLRDHIPVHPIIDRVAENAAANLEALSPRLKISGNSETAHFFRPAALMVTELRQLHLKRVHSAMSRDSKLAARLEAREILKKKIVDAEIQQIRLAADIFRQNPQISGQQLMDLLKIPKTEQRKAQNHKNSEALSEMLKELDDFEIPSEASRRISKMSMSPLKKRQKVLKIEVPSEKSPLRPRNGLPPGALSPKRRKSMISPGSSQNFGPASPRSTNSARKAKPRRQHCPPTPPPAAEFKNRDDDEEYFDAES